MAHEDARARAEAFAAVLAARDAAGAAWVQGAVDALPVEPTPTALRVPFSRAGRVLGDALVRTEDAERVALDRAGAKITDAWVRRDLARAVLVLHTLARLPEDRHPALVTTLVRRGEIGEQCSILRILPVLPQPGRFVHAAVEACRTNAEPVFASIAAGNPYPAAWFPDPAFDQMVLKAVFIGLPVDRIEGLSNRVTATTVRMARDYADERRAAGREVPADVDRIIEIFEGKP